MDQKVRINDLARELDVRSKSILDVLQIVGVSETKTHSSSLEPDEAERVRQYLRMRQQSPSRNLHSQTRRSYAYLETQRRFESDNAPPPVQPSATSSSVPPPALPRMAQTASPGAAAASSPRRNTAAFPFMRDDKFQEIAERDYAELQRVKDVGAIKARFILMGGLLEAFLIDVLLHDPQGVAGTKAGKKVAQRANGKADTKLDRWNLSDLIDAAVEMKFVKPVAKNLSHSVRDFRNLIHPGFEKRNEYDVRKDEADIAEKILEVIINDLRKCSQRD